MKRPRKETIFRVLATIVVLLFALAFALDFRGDRRLLSELELLLFMVSFGLLFSVYALLGSSRADRLLARILWLGELPDLLWDKTIGRFVETPTLEPRSDSDAIEPAPPNDDP